MYKSYSDAERSMVHVLKSINEQGSAFISSSGKDHIETIVTCANSGYIRGVTVVYDASGSPHISWTENVSVTIDGMQFLDDNSLKKKISKTAFSTLKGVKGFLIAIIAGIVVEVITFILTGSGAMTQILQWLQESLP